MGRVEDIGVAICWRICFAGWVNGWLGFQDMCIDLEGR